MTSQDRCIATTISAVVITTLIIRITIIINSTIISTSTAATTKSIISPCILSMSQNSYDYFSSSEACAYPLSFRPTIVLQDS